MKSSLFSAFSFILAVSLLPAKATEAAESAYFNADGVQLHYVVAGAGETVVLLHGFSGSAQGLYVDPGTFAALTSAGYRVVALDQVGHGKSEKPYEPDRYGLQMVEDVRRLLDHLNVEKVHLMGYSMGAKVANTFRSRYPNRVESIVLGGYGWPWQTPELTLPEAEARLADRQLLPGNDLRALAAASTGMHQLTSTRENLRANVIPALGIIGDKDSVVPVADFETLQTTMGKLTSVTMPGTHAGPDGAPYKVRYANELVKFLASNR